MAFEVVINGKEYTFEEDYTIIQACEEIGVEIPRFCYHKRLKIAGNCRMCLVEVAGSPKLVASCSANITNKMNIVTDSDTVKKARQDVMELLLINHPLDCPVCDQGGECDLQDQAMKYGRNFSEFHEDKRVVPEKNFGNYVKPNMTRCIHCMRCIRFMSDVAGADELSVVNRGENSEIISAVEGSINSGLSGNIIDLCPVGALTNTTYAFKARPWELKRTDSVDINDSLCPDVWFDSIGNEILRVLPRENDAVNEEWISDKSRFSFDGVLYNRIMDPLLKISDDKSNGSSSNSHKFKKISWDEALKILSDKLLAANPSKIGVSSGDLVDFDSIVALKKLCLDLKIESFDCRSRVPNMPSEFDYLFDSKISGIEEADSILIIGSDIEKNFPVLNARIRRNVNERGLKVGLFGQDYDLRYRYEFLGDEYNNLFNKENDFIRSFFETKKPMIILSDSLFDDNLEELNSLLSNIKRLLSNLTNVEENWKTLNVLHKNVGTINGIKAGFYNKKFKDFNESILQKNSFDFLYLVGDDYIDLSKVNGNFVVYQGHHGGGNAGFADLILPSLAFTEKDGVYFNIEGEKRYANKVVNFPGYALDDLEIIKKIFNKLNIDFSSNLLEEVNAEKKEFFYGFESSTSDNINKKFNFSLDANDSVNIIVKNSKYYMS